MLLLAACCILLKIKTMKAGLSTLILLLLVSIGFAQPVKFEIGERRSPITKADKIKDAKYITDLSPKIWEQLDLISKERYFLNERRPDISPQPEKFIYPQERYIEVLDYVAVEISITTNGKKLIASSNSELLTAEQKNLLTGLGAGAVFDLKIKYKYKDTKKDEFGPHDYVVTGNTTITVVPETEAAYPGGLKNLSEYFIDHVISKSSNKDVNDVIRRATIVFTIDEQGKVINPKLASGSKDAGIDKLLIEALSHMPDWKPAQNAKGEKVKQEVYIPFNSGGC